MSLDRKMLIISPRFLFPVDSGGKIRTTQILRGMKGGAFEITLVSPAPPGAAEVYSAELGDVCDHFFWWPESNWKRFPLLQRLWNLLSAIPISVASDRSRPGKKIVTEYMSRDPDITVFDFPHAGVLGWDECTTVRAVFTHNVETEIFERHMQASSGLRRLIWANQRAKMEKFEYRMLSDADGVITVSQRDAGTFRERFDVTNTNVIQTGVDLDFHNYSENPQNHRLVFTGAMDWLANIDAIQWFGEMIWMQIVAAVPDCSMDIVGRGPPQSLISQAAEQQLSWNFTGFVDDVRDYVHSAAIFVIPLRVGGGTRLKVFEAMAMGCPVVSTSIGVEGLDVVDGEHYLRADNPEEFAEKTVQLLFNPQLRHNIAGAARQYVESNCSFQSVARKFEGICLDIIERSCRTAIQPVLRHST